MNILDIVIIAVVALLVLRGFWKGLIRQILGIAGAIAAFIVAIKFSGTMAAKFLTGFQPTTGYIVMFLAIFVACMIVVSLLAALIGKLMSAVGLGFFNRLSGAILGGAKGYFIVAAVVLVLVAFLPPKSGLLTESKTVKFVYPMADIISRFAPLSVGSKYGHNRNSKEKPAQPDKKKQWL
jgi:membrane protein required for colicin V production